MAECKPLGGGGGGGASGDAAPCNSPAGGGQKRPRAAATNRASAAANRDARAGVEVDAKRGRVSEGAGQGPTLVHFSAQLEPFLTQNTPYAPPITL